MSRQIPVSLTNMCMIRNGDQVLVQDRKDPDWPGITFPGGHVESGESFCASVIREVYEETGLTIENPRLCGVKEWENEDGSRYMVLLYKTELISACAESTGMVPTALPRRTRTRVGEPRSHGSRRHQSSPALG